MLVWYVCVGVWALVLCVFVGCFGYCFPGLIVLRFARVFSGRFAETCGVCCFLDGSLVLLRFAGS